MARQTRAGMMGLFVGVYATAADHQASGANAWFARRFMPPNVAFPATVEELTTRPVSPRFVRDKTLDPAKPQILTKCITDASPPGKKPAPDQSRAGDCRLLPPGASR